MLCYYFSTSLWMRDCYNYIRGLVCVCVCKSSCCTWANSNEWLNEITMNHFPLSFGAFEEEKNLFFSAILWMKDSYIYCTKGCLCVFVNHSVFTRARWLNYNECLGNLLFHGANFLLCHCMIDTCIGISAFVERWETTSNKWINHY